MRVCISLLTRARVWHSLDNDQDNNADFNASALDAFYKANGGAPVVAAPTTGRKRVMPKVSPLQKARD